MSASRSYPFHLSGDQRLLCRAIQCRDMAQATESVRQLIAQYGPEHTVTLARRNGVACIAGHGVAASVIAQATSKNSTGLPAGFADLHGAHELTAIEIHARMAELDAIGALLTSHDIPVVALKNAGIARGIFRCAGCNPMGDLDVLVRRSQFRRAHQLLLDYGYALRFRGQSVSTSPAPAAVSSAASHPNTESSPSNSDLLEYAEVTGGAEYCRQDEQGQTLWLELQWRPVAGRWIRPDQEPAVDELMERSLSVEGTTVRILAPADNLLQVALHTAKHSYVRAPGFRLHTDVDRIASRMMIDWDSFVRSVRRFRVRTPVYFSLVLAHELLGTPIPSDVLEATRPGGWRERRIVRSLHQVGLFDPDAPKFGRLHFIAFNGLLYDDLSGLARAVFPPTTWMQQRYGCRVYELPWAYLRRGLDLVMRHQDT